METIDINEIYEVWFEANYEVHNGLTYVKDEALLVLEVEVQEDFQYYLKANNLR